MLNTESNLRDPDAFYETLIEAHRGLSEDQSAAVNARLVLLLANHVGDAAVLAAALRRARAGIVPAGDDHTLAALA